jgi:hypothetical protein
MRHTIACPNKKIRLNLLENVLHGFLDGSEWKVAVGHTAPISCISDFLFRFVATEITVLTVGLRIDGIGGVDVDVRDMQHFYWFGTR